MVLRAARPDVVLQRTLGNKWYTEEEGTRKLSCLAAARIAEQPRERHIDFTAF